MLMMINIAQYLLALWFNPILMILGFINTIIRIPFPFRNITVIFISNLIFWFLVGLFIDKIIHRIKNGN